MSMPLEDSTNRRVKFMCSFGGKILPRPGDGRLRYVGGETRIINVNRDISYTELMFKVTEIYGHALTLKYQLPDEELDALVSVSSDEDLENMMEEYDKLEGSDGFSRLRIFLFPAISQDMASLIHVPVALPVSSVPLSVSSIHTNADVPSLPTSAPVSPPLIPRTIPPPIGSDPSSPRISFQESGRYPGGYQQSQVHRGYNGADYQPAHVSSERLQHEQRLYELNTLSQSQISDPVTRSPIPHYVGSNPFQEGLPVYEEYQDAVHKQQYQMDGNQALYTEQQRHFHPQQSSSRLEYQNQNLLLDDRPPLKGQKPLPTREMQSMLPPTSKMISNVVQTPSIQEFTAATTLAEEMPPSCLYPTVTSIPDCIPSACATAAINVEVVLPRTRLGNKSTGSFEREAGVQNHENMMSLLSSDLSASGHLASDMASALGSESATLIEQMKNDTREDGKGTWMHTSQAPLMSSPTFGFKSWEENLANIETEFEKVPTQQSLADEKVTPDAKSEKIEVKDQQFLVDALNENQNHGPVNLLQEELKKESYFCNTASDAEAEAISRGLQTIKDADLEEMRELGSGTFGTVYHGKWRGTDVAIKRIRASCFAGQPSEQERLTADFWKEASILSQLHHPNVVAFYGVVRDGPGGTLATVTEYMVNGSLKQVLQKRDRTIDRRKRLLIATDAAFGMEYLHSKNIVHFDLKCENLLVNMRDPHRPICKVGDLGLSKVKHQTMVSGGVRGTLPWMAPELLNGTSTMVTEKVDVFSFGIVMWELLTGEEPYANLHYGAIIGGIVNNTLRPEVPTWCDPTWKLLMERCWASEPVERPGFSEIASDLRTMAVATHPKAQGQFHIPPPETSSR
ncbi:unnamed protein product [Sphagnum jensenii]|uniref:Protein kinase domain-containing protein n=1 Tax=Sphagnum jensenii TaxID=128206 RepID=A0ABP0VS82_9BRYO